MSPIRAVAALVLFLTIGFGLSLEPAAEAAPSERSAAPAKARNSIDEGLLDWKVTAGTSVTSVLLPGAVGDLDTTFNGTGKVVTPGVVYTAVAVQSDGKIVAGGYGSNGINNDFIVDRYNPDGTMDTTFNGGFGRIITPVGTGSDQINAIAIQTDGKIVAAGSTVSGNTAPYTNFAVVRYNANGTLDTGFNGTGKVITDLGGGDEGRSVAIQSDGKIVVGGYYQEIHMDGPVTVFGYTDFALVRYASNGLLDTSFNGTGKMITSVVVGDDRADAVVVQPQDGKIIAAGRANVPSIDTASVDFALVRYNPNGSLDTGFGASGKVTTPVGNDSDRALALALQNDGKIVAGGSSLSPSQGSLVRYWPNGSLDTSFDADGKALGAAYIGSLAIQANNKIVGAGGSNATRYLANGSPDNSFSGDGVVPLTLTAAAVALDGQGRIVIAGSESPNGAIVRLIGDEILTPQITTLAPNWVNSSQAEFSASVDPHGLDTVLWWRYSATDPGTCNDSFGETSPHFGVGSGAGPFVYSQTNGGLLPSTTYYYCAIATSAGGTSFGNVISFTTAAPTPTPSPTATPSPTPTCAWSASTAYPQNVTAQASTVHGGLLYSFGGSVNGSPTADSYKFDGTTWTPISPLPAVLAGAAAVSDGTNIYILGGRGLGGPLNTVYRYDSVANSYLLTPSFMQIPLVFHSAAYLNGKIYTWGGNADGFGSAIGSLRILDLATGVWTPGSPTLPVLMGTAFVHGGYIYSVGGAASFSFTSPTLKTFRYDPTLNVWDDLAIADLPEPRSGAIGSKTAFGTGLIVAGGAGFSGQPMTSVVSWDPAANTWTPLAPTSFPQALGIGGVIGGAFHVSSGTASEKLNCSGAPPVNEVDFCVLQFPPTINTTPGSTTPPIFGRVFEAGLTESPGASPSLIAQVGYGAQDSDPRNGGWNWFAAGFNTQAGNDDEYSAVFTAPAAGQYRYTYRFSLDGGTNWTYADNDGSGSNPGLMFDPALLGQMNVIGSPTPTPTPTATATPTTSPTPGCGWSSAAAYPTPTSLQAGVSHGGFLYSFGGVNGDPQVPSASSYKFDGTTWTPIAPLPEARWAAAAVTDGTSIYILGGANQESFLVDTVYKYNPAANSYTSTTMPLPRALHTAAYLNGKIYVWGGTTDGDGPASSSHSVFDIAGGNWTTAASVPVPAAYASAFVHNGFIYSVGGAADYITAEPMATTLRYNPATNTWDNAAMADLPQPRMSAIGSTVAFNGGLALVGGSDTSTVSWDPSSNTWNPLPSASTAHSGGVGGVMNETLYVSSGSTTEKLACTGGPEPTPTPDPTPTPQPSPDVTIDFGNQSVGTTSAVKSVTFLNGESELVMGTPTFAEGSQFALVSDPNGTVVPPGGEITFEFTFTPTSIGPKMDTVTVTVIFDGTPVPVATIGLIGNGVSATPTPSPTQTPTPVPTPTPSPDISVDFGNQQVGTTSSEQTVFLINNGEVDLVMGTPTFAVGTQFALTSNPNGTVVPPGGQVSVGFSFTPTSAGPKADTVTIQSSFGAGPVIALSGNGVSPSPTPTPTPTSTPTPTPTPTPATDRVISFVGSTAPASGGQVITSVRIAAQGDENGAGFSLEYDPALLSSPVVALGPEFADAALFVNANTPGRLGVVFALPAGSTIPAGDRDLVTITFNTSATSVPDTPVTFGDTPVTREVADTNAESLPASFLGGTVSFAHGFEADVVARPSGNGAVTVADLTQVGRFSAGLDAFNTEFNEFQRTDSAPRSTLGNGAITVADYTQAGRYAAGLDALTYAGGPTSSSQISNSGLRLSSLVPESQLIAASTTVYVASTQGVPGNQVAVAIMTDAQGIENGYGFTLDYDPAVLQNPVVSKGSDAQSATLFPNTATAGKVGAILAFPVGVAIPAGTKQLVTITFNVSPNAAAGATPLTFSDSPVVREISDVEANTLESTFTNGTFTVAGSAAEINVSPSSIDFGEVSTAMGGVGRLITVSNSGTEDLVIFGGISGPDAAVFTTSQLNGAVTINPGQSTGIAVLFDPQTIGPRSAVLTINSNDADEPAVVVSLTGVGITPGSLQFSSTSYSGGEGDGTIALTVQRVGGSQGAVAAFFNVSGGLATGGSACNGAIDYVNSVQAVTFADGETASKTVLITVCDDDSVEETETFNISLMSDRADMGSNTSAIVAIMDNDEQGQIDISGTITAFGNGPLPGHTVNLAGTSAASVSTNGSGAFTFTNMPGGSYLVTPASDPSLLFDPISRSYPNRNASVTDANFVAYVPGTEPRTLTVVNGFVTPGNQVVVPVLLESQGNESGLTFSLAYDPALLSGAIVECGTDAGAGCALTVSTDVPGKIGVSVDPATPAFAAGTREVVRVLFFTPPSTAALSTPVTFANDPAISETSDANANPLLTRYIPGSVVFIHGIESDVSGRPTGDGSVTSTDVSQVRRFAVGLDAYDPQNNEFQRADSAPYATAGDGIVAATDITQARRYQIGLDSTQPAGGPSSPATSLPAMFTEAESFSSFAAAARSLSVVSMYAGRGAQVTVPLIVDAEGDENVYGFTIAYDPAVLSDPVVAIGADAAGGNVLANTSTYPGKIGFSIDFGSGAMPAGLAKQLATVTFTVRTDAPFGPSPITFSDVPAVRQTSNSLAQPLQTTYADGAVTVLAPTAGPVTVSGRVTDSTGRGLSGAYIYFTDGAGSDKYVVTNLSGYYRVYGLVAGSTYTATVRKRVGYTFDTRLISPTDNVAGFDFVAR